MPKIMDFDNKKLYFRTYLDNDRSHMRGDLNIQIRREEIFVDSFHQITSKTPQELKVYH